LQQQIQLTRDGRERTVTVRITSEQAQGAARGFVVTLDDITDLVSAQRTSAWADVARRIAHEIKNPLSGIRGAAQLLETSVDDQDRTLTRLICDEADRIVKLVDRMEVFSDERPV
ncbi:histidine kinase dimerization/phospho-acceptor domain-containing protein, partial [Raoultella ornithinolytica]|uniref:histidine kinase dimerization/phospho-acceptor domain-containing protein n=1 Tax=Raoultella ornithinolytica TaxID=54291 RepID=UPI0030DCD0F4